MPAREIQVRKNSRLFAELSAALLRRGYGVQFRAHGESMRPNLHDGDDVFVAPADAGDLRRGDLALVENTYGLLVHRVASDPSLSGAVITRSDTAMENDAPAWQVLGRVVAVSHSDRKRTLNRWHTRVTHPLASFIRRICLAGARRLPHFLLALIAALVWVAFSAPTALAQADLTMTQAASVSVVATGVNYSYTEVATNNGPGTVPANTLVIYQQTTAFTTFRGLVTSTNWTCNTPGNGGTGPIICTYNLALASGASTTSLVFNERVIGGTAAGTTVLNSATVTSQTVDPVPTNNTTLTSVLVEPAGQADLAVSLSASPTPVFVFSTLTYSIQVQNLGQANAANVSLTDTIPAGATFVSATPSQGGPCTFASPTVTCPLGTINNAAGASVSLVVTAPPTATTLTNVANVSSTTADPVAANNSATIITVTQPLACATPGRDGAGGTLSGVVNTYYPATATANAGAAKIALGASSGAAKPIAAGDLLLVIQMQDAAIDSTNTSSYGHGTPGEPASGSTNLNSSGDFEFVTATNAVPLGGGTLTLQGTGAGNGLLNTYTIAASSGTQGQRVFQVIRVPQYTSATLGSGLVPLAWNGSVGGVLALDVASQLTLSGTVAADALGFRGGGGRILTGGTGADTDYVTLATDATNGSKGEGIAGTPRYLAPATITTATVATDTGIEGLPNGSYARGAPGNAGGGGTDGDPAANDFNSGGGAGGNGGTGGLGGYGWNSFTALNSTNGGFGGVVFPATTSALVMGGGGGAGTTNNGSYYISGANHNANCGANCTGIFSSGGAGGGIVIVHTGSVTGTGTVTSNGQSTLSTDNDSTGGAGAGGSIIFYANSGGLGGLTVNANGGDGGNAWPEQAPGAFSGQRHGPGGGGGGGVILLSGAPAALSVSGGNNGYTDTVGDSYGASPGQTGLGATNHIITETPGTQPGAYCAGADLSVTNSGSPAVVAQGGLITYTQVVTNNGPLDAVNAVFSETVPGNTVFQSIAPPAGWTCITPAVGATGNISCSNPDFAAGTNGTFTVVVTVGAATPSGTQIVDVDDITSGTRDPNLANNSATAITTVSGAALADLVVTNTASAPTVNAGSNVTMTAVVTNQGPSAAISANIVEATPASTTFVSLVIPPGWSCSSLPPPGGAGNIICSIGSLAAGGTATFPIVLNVNAGTASGTVISDTVTVASTTGDPNPTNNTATATTVVATPGQADLAVSTSAIPNPVSQGSNITYTQFVTNNGPATETNATFTDTIPANTTLVSFTPPANWTCNAIAPGGTGTFTCTLNAGQTILSGVSVSFPLVVKVNAGTAPGTTISNSPSIASTVGDPNPGNNTATASVIVASPTQADVSITKTASPEPVNQGTNLAYTLQVANGGPAIAQNVSVTDVLPAQVTFSSVFTSMGTCTYTASTTTVSCSLGSLSVGGIAVITINVTAATFSSNSLSSNTATVSSTTSDPNLANNSSTAVSTIQSPTAVDISSFQAFQQPDGTVVLEWRTHEESRNLGFHIYREAAAGKERITPSLVAGSALLLRGSKPQHVAKVYRWIDAQPLSDAAYWIEDVDINGTRTLHGPARIEALLTEQAVSLVAPVRASPLLRELRASVAAAPKLNGSRPLMRPRPVFPVIPSNTPRFTVADHDAVKIAVDHEGWYHVSFAQLVAAGFDPNSDLRSLHLFAEGVEQPILLTGASARSTTPFDGVEFYGTGIDTPFSDQRIYWLVHENQTGKRIVPVPSPVSGRASPASFPFSVLREDRTTYFAALLNGENNDNFFGAVITSVPVDQELLAAHVDSSSGSPVTLDVTLQGGTDQQDHLVSVQFNCGAQFSTCATLGQMEFFGQVLVKQSFPVDASLLREGSNVVTLTALNGDNDVSVVQSIELNYPHTYAADADWLRATAPAGSELHLTGFSKPAIRVFDITDILNIEELTAKVTPGSDSYEASLALSSSGPAVRTILAFSADAVSAPVSLSRHLPTFLDDRRAGSDIVIITHPDFAASLTPLVRYRELQGHRVTLVTTEQVYEEYNYGERSPFAIRSFLNDAATHWQRKPQALLLVGDASFDPRNYLGLGDFDFVPTRLIETAAFKTASDDWFTDFRQTGYATLPTGRLPVRTAADADLLVSRIVNYEQGSFTGSWNGQALLVADQNVDANFSSALGAAAADLPPSLQVTKILADGLNPDDARHQIIAALNNGALLVDYQGHGAEQQWSFEDLFDSTDAAGLSNGGRLPVYLLMDCLNGFFQDVYAESLAESILLAPNGGGIAVWASSGFTEQAPQASMNQAFLHLFATHPKMPLGWLILQTKAGTSDNDVRRTWILFGDPSMRIQISPSSTPATLQEPPERGERAGDLNRACTRDVSCIQGKEQQ